MGRFGLFSIAAVAAVAAALPAQAGDSEIEKICAKADKQYEKFFGDQTVPEGVAIVMMHKYTFCPPDLTVKAGTTVRWVNVDKRTSHSVWFKVQGKPESDRLFSEESIEMKFDEPGEYPYVCGPHHEQENMVGSLTVTP